MFAIVVAGVTTILTFAGIFFCIAALWSARSFVRTRTAVDASFTPPVTILKALKGFDPGMYEAFASHCRQDYTGEYELLFGVASPDDPAVEAVHRLQAEFPDHNIRLIQTPERLGSNGKVSNLTQLVPHAKGDYLIVNDSDILVSPHYLSRITAGFATPQRGKQVGMVTAPYRGATHGTIGSKMEALGITTDFFPGVLIALKMEKEIRFGLGSTLAVSREALASIGGFESLVDTLADDYLLGYRIAQQGYGVVLSKEVVATAVPAYSLAGYFSHQLRWARSIRDSRKGGYIGLLFTFVLPWAILNTIASGFSLESLAVLSFACLARVTVALAIGVGLLGDGQVLRDLWLLPLRDLAALGVWVWSFAGNTVTWRGQVFTLKDGVLTPKG
ncbi:bacteriohopanetetrol glucosamine biosynthesis glycosyltransferase HpnI [Silvibacterium acidisoli]|uniref:bacteriohopanetetrol glucosamine biosynthesis glycosyltransferase HpnI n=1 Tax=Acidobacteriaceae bacterium ZG23-2 TaxID=2883246 RepID=UPI00406D3A77